MCCILYFETCYKAKSLNNASNADARVTLLLDVSVMLTYACIPFAEVDTRTLYEIMRLRQEVFVVEQQCCYLDADRLDYQSWQVIGLDESGAVLAHSRLLPRGSAYPDYPSIGRVMTSASIRRSGEGRRLMAYNLEQCARLFPGEAIKIGAQLYLVDFYRSFGFDPAGQIYLEDGIEHIHMIRQAG